MRAYGWALIVVASTVVVACAQGEEPSSTFSGANGGGAGVGGAGVGGATATTTATTTTATTSTTTATTTTSTSTTGTTTTSSTSSTSSSSTGGSTGGCDYSATDSCFSAVELTSVDGDQGSDKTAASGTTSAWYKIYIAENYNLPGDISYTATLQSPTGMHFDLYVYKGTNGGTNCAENPTKATGTPASFHDSWSDSWGTDDGTWIALEVRYISGTSSACNQAWTLTVQGDN